MAFSPNSLKHEFVVVDKREQNPKLDKRQFNKGTGRGENYKKIHDFSFTNTAKVGLAIKNIKAGIEAYGQYTNDRLRQRQISKVMTLATYAVGIKLAGPIGIAYAVGDMTMKAVGNAIENDKKNIQARVLRDISGIAARERSRSSGVRL